MSLIWCKLWINFWAALPIVLLVWNNVKLCKKSSQNNKQKTPLHCFINNLHVKVGYLPTEPLFTSYDSRDCNVLTKFLHLFYRWVSRAWVSYLMGLWPYGKSAGGPWREVRAPASHLVPGAWGGYSWCFACLIISVKVNKLVLVSDFRRNWGLEPPIIMVNKDFAVNRGHQQS